MSRRKKQSEQNSPMSADNRLIGVVRALKDGYGFVELQEHENLSLGKQDMRRVFPGDLVEVKAGREDRKGRIQGRILEVVERNTSELVGTFNTESGCYGSKHGSYDSEHSSYGSKHGSYSSKHSFSFVRPSNRRICHDIHIPGKASAGAEHGQLVVVEITEQPDEFAPAYGRIVEVLGDSLSAGMEIQVALRSFDIPHQWPEEVEDEANKLGSFVKASHKKQRLDLRDLPFVTIDGEDARDFDDAVFAEQYKGGWKLWVAIADVCHYVKPDSALDKEAQDRGTSVYFPEYVVPMLPEVLSNGLCSLKPKVDRLAMVCEMDIDASGQITDFSFAEALIRSRERLTYTRVAKALDEKQLGRQALAEKYGDGVPSEREKLGALRGHIDQLYELYKVLFAARQMRGAMEFETVEVRFEFDRNRKIEKIVPVQRNNAHRLIEECMLCANICAAEFLNKNELPGLYRVHMPPANEKLAALRDYLSELGLWLGGGEQPTPADFKKLAEAMADRPDRSVIQTMILRSQQQAVYQPENKGHFGLAYPAYAHFTSPIRRYPDLLVHRAIRSVIRSSAAEHKSAAHIRRIEGAPAQAAKRNYPYDLEMIQALGQSCSTFERRAEQATRDVAQWLKCEFLQKHLGDSFMGVVTSVTHFGLFVQIVDFYIEGLIHITNLPHDYYEYDSIKQLLIGQSSRRTFKTGDKARVQVARVDLDERKIELVLTDRSTAKDSNSKDGDGREWIRSGPSPRNTKLDSGKKTKNRLSPSAGAKKADARRSRKNSARSRK